MGGVRSEITCTSFLQFKQFQNTSVATTSINHIFNADSLNPEVELQFDFKTFELTLVLSEHGHFQLYHNDPKVSHKQVWAGSTLFVILSASFGRITQW